MDLTKINSWNDFSENFDQIKKDHLDNIGDDKKRISYIIVLLKSEPKLDLFDSGENDSMDNMNRYYHLYKEIMKTYIINRPTNMGMMTDIMKTELFNSLDYKEQKLFSDFHKMLGNEVMEDLLNQYGSIPI